MLKVPREDNSASLETLANQLDNAFGNAFAQYALVDAISELSKLAEVLSLWTHCSH